MSEERQFDTSPHHLMLNDHPVKAQYASLVLAYSRRLFIRYFPDLTRLVDVQGYVYLDSNRYSVSERLIGKKVEVYKYTEQVKVLFRHREVAEQPRLVGQPKRKAPSRHTADPKGAKSIRNPATKSGRLCGESDVLNRYVAGLKKRRPGRGVSRQH